MKKTKSFYRYRIVVIRDKGNGVPAPLAGESSNDLDHLRNLADNRRPAFVVDNWAQPTPEVVHVAIKDS